MTTLLSELKVVIKQKADVIELLKQKLNSAKYKYLIEMEIKFAKIELEHLQKIYNTMIQS